MEDGQMCRWCEEEALATWDHCTWRCTGRTKQMDKPRCEIQSRLGWHTHANKKYNEEVITHIKESVRTIWEDRHG